jgi:hypothetical protein
MTKNENKNIDPRNAIYEIVIQYMTNLQIDVQKSDYQKLAKREPVSRNAKCFPANFNSQTK